ncbi:MAG: hypothetical protein IJX28_06900 [Clostridia bacterium]|nr:hypothetical protein [Clostridia bacterium]
MKRLLSILLLGAMLLTSLSSCGNALTDAPLDLTFYPAEESGCDKIGYQADWATNASKWTGGAIQLSAAVSGADTSWYAADKTAFSLKDAADFVGFLLLLHGGTTFEGATVTLETNVDLGKAFLSGANPEALFAGTLNGNGKTVGGFAMTCTAGGQALLGNLGGGATVTDLAVADASYTLESKTEQSFVGTLFARVITAAGKTAILSNLYSNATVTGASGTNLFHCVGGIVGAVDGTGSALFSGCEFAGSLTSAGSKVGGMAGSVKVDVTQVTFQSCKNSGAISGKEQLGGMVGMFDEFAGTATFRSCTNTGDITILSNSDSGQAGGMVGRYAGGGYLSFTGCRNSGDLTYLGTVGGGCWMGGIGGYLVGSGRTIESITLNNCHSTGKITANRTSGGLLGFVQTCRIFEATNCTVDAELDFRLNSTKNPYVGAFIGMINLGNAGQMSSYKATISDCEVVAKMTTTDVGNHPTYSGGLIGALRTTTVNLKNVNIDVEMARANCEEDDVFFATLGYNQDNAAVIQPENVTYRWYNEIPTVEEYLEPVNEEAVFRTVGMQYRRNPGVDGVGNSSDDTYDFRYVFGVKNLSADDLFLGFDVTTRTLGEKVTTTTRTVYCPNIYKSLSAGGEVITARECQSDYLFTLTITGIPSVDVELVERDGYTYAYVENCFLSVVPFTAQDPEAERNYGYGLREYGQEPAEVLAFERKHFSPSLPAEFANAVGIISQKKIDYPAGTNLSCVTAAALSKPDQYVLKNTCTCGNNCDWVSQGSTAYRLNENVLFHYYPDPGSYAAQFGESLDRYEAYHTWSFEVEEDGYYEFCFQIRLKGTAGVEETRYALVQIDDESYASQTELTYTIVVQDEILRDNAEDCNAYLVGYGKALTKGKHTITFRMPYDKNGVDKAKSFHIRDVYVVKGAPTANKAEVPTLEGAVLYDGNFNDNCTYVLNKTTYENFLAYNEKMVAAGFALKESRTTTYEYLPFDTPNYREGGDNEKQNHFRTYTNEDFMVHVYFCEGNSNMRVVVANIDEYNDYTAVKEQAGSYEKVTEPMFSLRNTGSSYGQGLCMVYRLSDGRYVVVDGGQLTDGNAKDIQEVRDLYNFMKENSPNGKVVVAAWLFTHLHSDHMNVAWELEKMYRDEIEIQNYMYNFPSYEYARSLPGSNLKVDYYSIRYPRMYRLLERYPNLVAHTGMVYQFADCTIEILFTHEDFYPNSIKNFNLSNTAYKITHAGKTYLVAGDLEEAAEKECNKMAGTLLDADFLQVIHHGYNGQIEFYQYIVNEEYDTTVALWPLPTAKSVTSSLYNRLVANKFLADNLKEIHFSSENYVYYPNK